MVENLTVKVTGIDGGDLVGTLDKWRIFAEELNGVTTVKVSPVQIGSVGLSLEEWHGQALSLMKTADFHNYWRGQPRGWLFDQLYAEGYSPIDALEAWRDWEPVEND